MANGPSNNALPNTCNLYRWAPTQDADAGATGGFGASADLSGVACSIQYDSEMVLDEQNRPTMVNVIFVELRQDIAAKLKDKITFTMDGLARSVFVIGYENQAGRTRVWRAKCSERQ